MPYWGNTERPLGLYLDGGFGVGKTHLLAAAYAAAPDPKAYLSFAELSYLVGAAGIEGALQALSGHTLICIDEFELDDPANTRLAATVLRHLLRPAGAAKIITTSNSLPNELGKGRFHSEDFRREIGEIAAHFELVHIDGEDYRRRTDVSGSAVDRPMTDEELKRAFETFTPATKAKAYANFEQLMHRLGQLHPIRYAGLLSPLEALFVEGLTPIRDQAVALRFVHFIDKAYDSRIALYLSSSCSLTDLFPNEYRNNGYRKKYQRCLSRLQEMLAPPPPE